MLFSWVKHTLSLKKTAWTIIIVVGVLELLVAFFLMSKLFPPSILPPTSIPVLTASEPTAPFPSEIMDLTNWKITLPVIKLEKPNRPVEIKQPDLSEFKINPWFTLTPDQKGVVFRAPVNGITTSGSRYPRSELREMTDNGKTNAGWSSINGTHTMFIRQAITAIPEIKQQIVAGQIHDENDDILLVRLDYPKLYININGKNVYMLDPQYSLGKEFSIKLEVNNGETKIYYNGGTQPVYTLPLNYSDAYFKAGAYTQSNCNTEKSNALCTIDNFGEVIIYELTVNHK